MPKSEEWTAVNVKKTQMSLIDKIAERTKLRKCDIVEIGIRKAFSEIVEA